MKQFSFEKLTVWQKGKELVKLTYKVTQTFPTEERYGFTSQMRRAALSVTSNLAEGSARKGKKDKARFTEISFSSLIELLSQAILAFELDYIKEEQYLQMRTQTEEIARMLNALQEAQLR